MVPLPYEGGVSYLKGAANGPQAILNASDQLELFDPDTKISLKRVKFHTVPCPDSIPSLEDLKERVSEIFKVLEPARQFYLGIGGDHCVTVPAVAALHRKYKEIGVVQIDAHMDLRDSYEGSKNSHACVMRRIAEIIGPKNIVSIGTRAFCEEEIQYAQRHKIGFVLGNRPFHEDYLADLNEKLARLPKYVFLTIDLDGLDPSVIPDVGTPVPGGLSWMQCISILRRVFERKAVVGADVVEIASKSGSERSDFAASLLCQKILSHAIQNFD